MHWLRCWLLALPLLAAGFGTHSHAADPSFRHDFAGAPTPWTDQAFDNGPDKFTFAIFSDLTGGEDLCFEAARCDETR